MCFASAFHIPAIGVMLVSQVLVLRLVDSVGQNGKKQRERERLINSMGMLMHVIIRNINDSIPDDDVDDDCCPAVGRTVDPDPNYHYLS